jgi:hypothetical protein
MDRRCADAVSGIARRASSSGLRNQHSERVSAGLRPGGLIIWTAACPDARGASTALLARWITGVCRADPIAATWNRGKRPFSVGRKMRALTLILQHIRLHFDPCMGLSLSSTISTLGSFQRQTNRGEPALVRDDAALRPCIRSDPRGIRTMKQSFASAARLRGGGNPILMLGI